MRSYLSALTRRRRGALTRRQRLEFIGRIAALTLGQGAEIDAGKVAGTNTTCGQLIDRYGPAHIERDGLLVWLGIKMPEVQGEGALACRDFGKVRAVYFSGWHSRFRDINASTLTLRAIQGDDRGH